MEGGRERDSRGGDRGGRMTGGGKEGRKGRKASLSTVD